MKEKLSVIIPYAQEHPQIAFTVQSIFCELRDSCDFEIIVIDNHCPELQRQLDEKHMQKDKGSEYMSGLASANRPWLKYVKFEKKLSHWNAKNAGIAISEGDVLWFCDSHCIVSQGTVRKMYSYYREHWQELNGTLHLPISYMLEQPGLELIYKLVLDKDRAIVHYSFTRYRHATEPYQVPCMSTCGMMMHRSIYDELGGWPAEMGIYGGGGSFVNFTLAVQGRTVNIMTGLPLFHYAAPRGYYWNYNDFHRNRTIASFMYGGQEFAKTYIMNVKGKPLTLEKIYTDVVLSTREQRDFLEQRQKISIEDWMCMQTGG